MSSALSQMMLGGRSGLLGASAKEEDEDSEACTHFGGLGWWEL
jgi:hypothetical protein